MMGVKFIQTVPTFGISQKTYFTVIAMLALLFDFNGSIATNAAASGEFCTIESQYSLSEACKPSPSDATKADDGTPQHKLGYVNPFTASLVDTLREHSISSANEELSFLVLLRHSERPPIRPEDGTGNNVLLTEQGKAVARQLGSVFGDRLESSPRKLFASPVRRCQETLEEIIAGARWDNVDFQVKPELLGIGNIYSDIKLAAKTFTEIQGVRKLIAKAMNGEHLPGIVPIAEAAPKLLEFLKTELHNIGEPSSQIAIATAEVSAADANNFVVMVSHDFNIAVLLVHYFGVTEFNDHSWPNFLEGMALVKNARNNTLKLIWRNREVLL